MNLTMTRLVAACALAAGVMSCGWARAATVTVSGAEELRQAAAKAGPGSRILLAPGEYTGGLHFGGLRGEKDKPIVIAAQDPRKAPVIRGGETGLHLNAPAWVELHDLVVTGAAINGINIDEGGPEQAPARGIVLRNLRVADVGAKGNNDCIKLSGLEDFRVEGCTIERWGSGSGSGIDMVGCRRGVIEGCVFRHTDSVGSAGIQAKGGSSQIVIRRNHFENAGGRAVNVGGGTGLKFFRPPLKDPPFWEARDIRVEGNTFTGGGAAVAFVGVDGATVRFNTIYCPGRWVLRILQETRTAGFVPSRNGEFTDNIIAFRAADIRSIVNIGEGTAPETFVFARNLWYCMDDAQRSRPSLPTQEKDGVYGHDPLFVDAAKNDLRVQSGSPARKMGADALPVSQGEGKK